MKPGLAVLPLEVWADIFISKHKWISRRKLAQIANNIKDRKFSAKLQKLLHDCGRKTLEYLEIDSKLSCEPKRGKYNLRKRKIPRFRACLGVDYGYHWYLLPESEMPENIKTINELAIRYVDDEVLDFLNKIKRLFTNVVLDIEEKSATNMRIFLGHLIPMMGNIRRISCLTDECIQFYAQHFPETLARAKELVLWAEPASIPACLNWLSTPQNQNFEQHGPRFMKICAYEEYIVAIVDAVRKNFLESTTPSTFIIYLQFNLCDEHPRPDEFQIENAVTNELLAVRNALFKTSFERDIHYMEILRHPAGADAKIREWMKNRAYFEKYSSDHYDEAEQIISTAYWHISKKRKAIAMNEAESDDGEDGDAGLSTFAKKIKN